MSKDTFKNNPDLQEYFETSDGTQFYKEDLAKNHARTLTDATVKPVLRPEEKEVKLTAAEIIALAPEMDFEQAAEYLTAEKLLAKPRKSVIEALTDRNMQLETEKSAARSAAEFKTGNKDVNVIDNAGNVLGDKKAGAPFEAAKTGAGDSVIKK